MPQPADFPISMRRPKDDGSAEHVYANSQQEWENLQAAGFSPESSVRVSWPKLLRHPNGHEVTVANETELKAKQAAGYGFPRDVPRPQVAGEAEMVSVDEMAALKKGYDAQLAVLTAKLDELSKPKADKPKADK